MTSTESWRWWKAGQLPGQAAGHLLLMTRRHRGGPVAAAQPPLNHHNHHDALPTLPGRDSFFCCDTTRATGYSGTATYVRSGVALPFAAEEGFTGCAPLAAGEQAARMGLTGCSGTCKLACLGCIHAPLPSRAGVRSWLQVSKQW